MQYAKEKLTFRSSNSKVRKPKKTFKEGFFALVAADKINWKIFDEILPNISNVWRN
jgi:hypothetical protein